MKIARKLSLLAAIALASCASSGHALIETAASTLQVNGSVRDKDGNPIAGVTIVVNLRDPQFQTRPPHFPLDGSAPPVQSKETVIETWRYRQALTPRATTDELGNWTLPHDPFDVNSVQAYRQGWKIKRKPLPAPQDDYSFEGYRMPTVHLDVQLPDGTEAAQAKIRILTSTGRTRFVEWNRESRVLFLTEEHAQLQALAGIKREAGYNTSALAMQASEIVAVPSTNGAPSSMTLALSPKVVVQGTVDNAWLHQRSLSFFLQKAGESERKLDAPQLHFLHPRRQNKAEFDFSGVARGAYAFSIRNEGGEVLYQDNDLELSLGLNTLDLSLPAPDPELFVLLRCFDPMGQPLTRVTFLPRIVTHFGGGDLVPPANKAAFIESPDSSLWVRMPHALVQKEREGLDWKLIVDVYSRYGSGVVQFGPDSREQELHFAHPVPLVIQITGFAQTENPQELYVEIQCDMPVPFRTQARADGQSRSSGGVIIPSTGSFVFPAVPPGPATLKLWRHSSLAAAAVLLEERSIQVSGKGSAITITVPELYELEVDTSGLAKFCWLKLQRIDDSGKPLEPFRRLAIDGEQSVTFLDLCKGAYLLFEGSSPTLKIQIPGPKATYDPPRVRRFQIAITDKSGELFQAGLRDGDVIQTIDGTDLAALKSLKLFFETLSARESTLTVLRNGGKESLQMGPLSVYGRHQDILGGLFIDIRE